MWKCTERRRDAWMIEEKKLENLKSIKILCECFETGGCDFCDDDKTIGRNA